MLKKSIIDICLSIRVLLSDAWVFEKHHEIMTFSKYDYLERSLKKSYIRFTYRLGLYHPQLK